MKYNPDLVRGNTESILLYVIEELGSTYGYRLIKEIEKRSEGFFRFKEGTVYPALHKLESEGMIEGSWRRLPSGQERRYYGITVKGKNALRSRLEMWRDFAGAMNRIYKPIEG